MPVLTLKYRKKIFQLFNKGKSCNQVFDELINELSIPDFKLARCISNLKGKWKQKNPDKNEPEGMTYKFKKVQPKSISKTPEFKVLENKIIATGNNHLEEEPFYKEIAEYILNRNNISVIENDSENTRPRGTPFDLIGKKDGKFILIELKGSLNQFHYPDGTQYARMKMLLEKLNKKKEKFEIYLLQVNLRKGKKLIFYNLIDDIKMFFTGLDENLGKHISIDRVVDWVNEVISEKL